MIVFPMAGLSSRFTKAGYDRPKYKLLAQERTLFDLAVSGFRSEFGKQPFLFICLNVADTPAFVKEQCVLMGLTDFEVIALDEPTSGQAETVSLGLSKSEKLSPTDPITIFNIDTFRPHFEFPDILLDPTVDGYLEVFQGPGEHWSFVLPSETSDKPFAVEKVTEKVRISDLCSSGLYYFREAKLFTDAYAKIANRPVEELQGGERYVAPLYNDLIADGKDIRYAVIDRSDVIFCGVPDEYQDFLNSDIKADW